MIDRYDAPIVISNYLFEHMVIIRNNKIGCKFVKEDCNGSSFFHIRSGLFEHSKQIQDLIRNTPANILISYFSRALEQVFGQKYTKNVRVEVVKK